MIKKVSKALLILAFCIALGTAAMISVYSLPTDEMIRHVKQSQPMLTNEARVDAWAYNLIYTQPDNYTDSAMLLAALSSPYDSPVESALLNPLVVDATSNLDPEYNLNKLLDGENRAGFIYNYFRYWHGYLLFLKPMLLFFNVSDIKVIAMMLQFFLIAGTLSMLKKENTVLATLFAVVVLFINPITTAISFQLASIFNISLLTMIIMLKYRVFFNARQCWWILFLLDGVAVAFFDFLTYPMAAIGLPLITLLLIDGGTLKENIIRIAGNSFAWLFGYAGMWAGKFAITALAAGTASFKEGWDNVLIRTDTGKLAFGDCMRVVFYVINNRPMYFLALVCVVMVGVFAFVNKADVVQNAKNNSAEIISFFLVGLYPIVWYFVLRNHTYVHPNLEYRELSVTVWAVLAIAAKLVTGKRESSAHSAKLLSTP